MMIDILAQDILAHEVLWDYCLEHDVVAPGQFIGLTFWMAGVDSDSGALFKSYSYYQTLMSSSGSGDVSFSVVHQDHDSQSVGPCGFRHNEDAYYNDY